MDTQHISLYTDQQCSYLIVECALCIANSDLVHRNPPDLVQLKQYYNSQSEVVSARINLPGTQFKQLYSNLYLPYSGKIWGTLIWWFGE